MKLIRLNKIDETVLVLNFEAVVSIYNYSSDTTAIETVSKQIHLVKESIEEIIIKGEDLIHEIK